MLDYIKIKVRKVNQSLYVYHTLTRPHYLALTICYIFVIYIEPLFENIHLQILILHSFFFVFIGEIKVI